MQGAIIGDIIGSVYEFHNIKTKDFSLFCDKSHFTDDTILTCATADWLIQGGKPDFFLKKWGKMYIDCTYENGKITPFNCTFIDWLKTGTALQSKSNGCVMRISPLLHLKDKDEALEKAIEITKTTHDHPESLNAVQAYIETGFMLKENEPTSKIKQHISDKYWYNLGRSVINIRQHYNHFYCSCEKSVPEAICCALEAKSYEDAIRNAVSIGGDSDTLACMAGGLAEMRHPIPQYISSQANRFMDKNVLNMVKQFYHGNA